MSNMTKGPIFGDDGFRDRFGFGLMRKKNLFCFAMAISLFIRKNGLSSRSILIGRDTRESGKKIESLLVSVFKHNGLNSIILGEIATPIMSYALKPQEHACGIMITASHNPPDDNGIKLFSSNGFKMPRLEERDIERDMLTPIKRVRRKNKGSVNSCKNVTKEYFSNLLAQVEIRRNKMNILIDCANGGMTNSANLLKSSLDNICLTNNLPTGFNINFQCGALEPDALLLKIREKNFDFGIAFDGDGDRAVFMEKEYGIIEAEKLFYIFAQKMSGSNFEKSLVASEIINFGALQKCKSDFKEIFITPVGDRNIIEKAIDTNSVIGVEPSGHFFFPGQGKSMDGMACALNFIKLINRPTFDLFLELNSIHLAKRKVYNFQLKDIERKQILLDYINKIATSSDERMIARVSIWEPILRVYYDYFKSNEFEKKYLPQIQKIVNEVASK